MSKIDILKLDLGERGYDIIIGSSIIKNAENYIKTSVSSKDFVIVTDENIPQEFITNLENSLQGIKKIIRLPAGEQTKNFEKLKYVLDEIFSIKPDRKITIIALGGGVIGDLTGFAASILLRGVNFIQIPTTLLSQVDSSVGGKTGINNKFGKNLVGSFYQPKLVLIDLDTIKTLPEREFLAGYAEVVKYALINDAAFFDYLEQNLDKILQKDEETLRYIINKSCKAKADIVAQDEREGGVRALLNLGHTFGHAIELACGYDGKIVHGEAVAIGMVFAFELSHRLGLCEKPAINKVKSHLEKCSLPTSPLDISDNWNKDTLLDAMFQDKKAQDGKLVFILANAIGDSFIKKDIDSNIVLDTIKQAINL